MFKDSLVEAAFSGILRGQEAGLETGIRLFGSQQAFEKPRVLTVVLRLMSTRLTSVPSSGHGRLTQGMASVIQRLIQEEKSLFDYLIDWLTSTSSGGVGAELGVRRAILAVLFDGNRVSQNSIDERKPNIGYGEQVLKRLVDQFGDTIFIQHSPILNQESELHRHSNSVV